MTDSLKEDPVLKGILDGRQAFSGPEIVQFDITNNCNNNCLCCWNNSPLLGEVTPERDKAKRNELPFPLIKSTLEKLKTMGTKTIFLAGGGEPFIHPEAMEILECIKGNGMRVFINTNFTLLNEEKIKRIVEFKVDHIHVSMLAGNEQTYCRMHPNKTEEDFFRIIELLKYLSSLKEKKQQPSQPHINMYNVICNINYQDIKSMVDLGFETKANSLEFTPMDAIPGKTDKLLLNDSQRQSVLREIEIENRRLLENNRHKGCLELFIEQYGPFIKRLSEQKANLGRYEEKMVFVQPCYVGWAFLRILADGNVNPCLKAHRISVGNIYNDSIEKIWNSPEQDSFRLNSFELKRNNPYFKMIGNDPRCEFGCLVACDNIQINVDMHNKYKAALEEHGKIKKIG